MSLPSFDEFAAAAREQGFDEILPRDWEADAVVPLHSHPFAVHALVTRGDFWLTVGDATRHLQAGDSFDLARDEPHAERYGSEGATYWAARRHAAPPSA